MKKPARQLHPRHRDLDCSPGTQAEYRRHSRARFSLRRTVLIALWSAGLALTSISGITAAQTPAETPAETPALTPTPDPTANQVTAQSDPAARNSGEPVPAPPGHVLDSLSDGQRDAVEGRCLPVQFREGAAAYHDCVNDQLTALSEPAASNRVDNRLAPLASLSFDDQYAVQQFCQLRAEPETQAYTDCRVEQIASLADAPAARLSALSDDDTYAVQQTCFQAQTSQGVRAYRDCIVDAVSRLLALPDPDLSSLSLLERNTLQLRCSAQSPDAAAYRRCLLQTVGQMTAQVETDQVETDINATALVTAQAASDALDIDSSVVPAEAPAAAREDAPAITPLAVDPASLIAEDSSGTGQNPIPSDTAIPAVPDLSQAGPDAAISETAVDDQVDAGADLPDVSPTGAAGIPASAEAWLDRIKTSFAALTGINRLLLVAALALPLLLTGIWLLLRNRNKKPEYVAPAHPAPLRERVGTTSRHQPPPKRPDTGRSALASSATFQEPPFRESDDGETVARSRADFAVQADELFGSQVPSVDGPSPAGAYGMRHADGLDYLRWLESRMDVVRPSLAIEFLVYWIAYADERYDPDLKPRIFQKQNPDDHDLIKRWVLKQDVHAFHANIRWMQDHLGFEQRIQVLKLLMAVLVNENALTPVQNTLLRFLGDAFGLGSERLDDLFRRGFGPAMPPLPRLDLPKWWEYQIADNVKRWDARSVSRQSQDVQHRVKLGLPLDGELAEKDIMDSFQRARMRCQPEQFDLLTQRERTLAERQLAKFEIARQALLEVAA